MKTVTISEVDNQGNRVILHYDQPPSRWGEMYIIAPAGCEVKPGDKVEYEPGGFNFYWFVKIVS